MIESFWRSSGNLSVIYQIRYCSCPNTFRAAFEGKLCEWFLANMFCLVTSAFDLAPLCVTKASRVSYVDIGELGYHLAWTDAAPPLTAASGITSPPFSAIPYVPLGVCAMMASQISMEMVARSAYLPSSKAARSLVSVSPEVILSGRTT